jgi:hypothetical protein
MHVVLCRAESAASPEEGASRKGVPSTSDVGDNERPVFSHKLNENFAAEELLEEMKDHKSFLQKGGLVLVLQVVLGIFVVLPPLQLQGVLYLSGVTSDAAHCSTVFRCTRVCFPCAGT